MEAGPFLLTLLGGTTFAEWYPEADLVAALRGYGLDEMLDRTEEEWLLMREILSDNQETVLKATGRWVEW